jgi:hypothetical protein
VFGALCLENEFLEEKITPENCLFKMIALLCWKRMNGFVAFIKMG